MCYLPLIRSFPTPSPPCALIPDLIFSSTILALTCVVPTFNMPAYHTILSLCPTHYQYISLLHYLLLVYHLLIIYSFIRLSPPCALSTVIMFLYYTIPSLRATYYSYLPLLYYTIPFLSPTYNQYITLLHYLLLVSYLLLILIYSFATLSPPCVLLTININILLCYTIPSLCPTYY